jgi:hypothetical protein
MWEKYDGEWKNISEIRNYVDKLVLENKEKYKNKEELKSKKIEVKKGVEKDVKPEVAPSPPLVVMKTEPSKKTMRFIPV